MRSNDACYDRGGRGAPPEVGTTRPLGSEFMSVRLTAHLFVIKTIRNI